MPASVAPQISNGSRKLLVVLAVLAHDLGSIIGKHHLGVKMTNAPHHSGKCQQSEIADGARTAQRSAPSGC
ncbi:hypothetical protein BG74_08590 [Sodalis-like endosymbiont of Proechinophthirus fluctus]|nr:hypothetical protein BG74_08590 [Sodalis-like endosymbiont of Proechinophthirus fluctus]